MRIQLLKSTLSLGFFVAETNALVGPSVGSDCGRRCHHLAHLTPFSVCKLWAESSKKEDRSSNNKDDGSWDSDVDYDSLLPQDPTTNKSPDPTLGWDVTKAMPKEMATGKVGINVGSLLTLLSEQEASEIKAAAMEAINEAVAAGIDDIRALRVKMENELEQQRRKMQRASERNVEQASAELLGKIDVLTDAFLSNTTLSRTSTKLAALADKAMEGRGVDMGTWGTLGGATVLTDAEPAGELSTNTAAKSSSSADITSNISAETLSQPQAPSRLLVVANTKDDTYAKQLLEPLVKELEKVLPSVAVQTIRPTDTWPLGANNAAAVLLFLTSLNEASTVKTGLERLTRTTLTAGGQVSCPPTQFIAVSTVGTARTNQMPYSMQNLMGGGTLEKRKQMEEVVQSFVEQSLEKRLDYTICKLGELKSSCKELVGLSPGDVLDGSMTVDAAVTVLTQAMALQPSARNSTFSCVGGSNLAQISQDEWDDLFLQLDGPELWRSTNNIKGDYDQLVEYLQEWSEFAETSKGLTTPIRVDTSPRLGTRPRGVVKQIPIPLLFLPTATGARYMSRDEEKARERERNTSGGGPAGKTGVTTTKTPSPRKATKEGGLEILVEETVTPVAGLRVRVRRCNYSPGVIIKELTEQTLLSRIKKTMDVWNKDHIN